MKKYLLAFLIHIGMHAASAQNNGISLSFFNAAFYCDATPFSQGYMGIGFEKNAGDYISLKLELNKGFQVFYSLTDGKILSTVGNNNEFEYSRTDSLYNTTSFYYHWTMPTAFELNYQSKFFFSGNDRSGVYLAMGIGVRSVSYRFHTGQISDNYGSEEIPSDIQKKDGYSESLVIIPLSLRFGARGDLQGFYPDFNMGVGYNFGHNKTVADKTITRTYDLTVPKLNGLSITASICFGVGW